MNDFYSRTLEIMKHYDLNQSKFAKRADVYTGAITRMKQKMTPNGETICSIVSAFCYPNGDFSAFWFCTGQGDMIHPKAKQKAVYSTETTTHQVKEPGTDYNSELQYLKGQVDAKDAVISALLDRLKGG